MTTGQPLGVPGFDPRHFLLSPFHSPTLLSFPNRLQQITGNINRAMRREAPQVMSGLGEVRGSLGPLDSAFLAPGIDMAAPEFEDTSQLVQAALESVAVALERSAPALLARVQESEAEGVLSEVLQGTLGLPDRNEPLDEVRAACEDAQSSLCSACQDARCRRAIDPCRQSARPRRRTG